MRVNGVHSISLFVPSYESVKDFYLTGLSLPFGATRPGLHSIYTGRTALALIDAGSEDSALVGRQTGMTLRTRGPGDFEQFLGRLTKNGNTVGAIESHAVGRTARLTDPVGNQFCLWDAPDYSQAPHLFDAPAMISIGVRDLRHAMPFYHGVLELPMFDQPDANTALFFPDATHVVISARPGWSPSPPAVGETGLCLRVEGLDSYVDGLKFRGAELVEESNVDGALIAAAIKDPDGNQITLIAETR
jgi:predicted enzyme related to lactoylglutathione lyase